MNNLPGSDLPLHDIHLPDAVSWWPPAIGWWLLPVVFILIALAIKFYIHYKKHHRALPNYKKIALAEFRKLHQQYANSDDSISLLRDTSTLLRRISLSFLPRESVASLTGDKWIRQLNALSADYQFTEAMSHLLINAPYQQQITFDHQELLHNCEQWIKALPDAPLKEDRR